MQPAEAISRLQVFTGIDLTQTLARIERSLQGATKSSCEGLLADCGAQTEVLGAAGVMKRLASQINVVVHAIGILLCLPHLLAEQEKVEYVSLGAGNTGRPFDLETNMRIAEFKFIHWQGGPEAIRQNALFKDFFLLAEEPTEKQKFLYVLRTEHPLKFLNGGRSLSSVLSRNVKLQREFTDKYGPSYRTVRDYYLPRKNSVMIQDISPFVQELVSAAIDTEGSD